MCETWHPHLIWMDMRMPVMNGYTATRHIKSTPHGQSIIIVDLTASAFEEEQAAIKFVGCDDFVYKPFHASTIFAVLQKHLDMRYRYAADPITTAPQPERVLAGSVTSDRLQPDLDMLTTNTNGTHPLRGQHA